MLISVVNRTNGTLSDEQVQDGIRAVNRQIAFDFKPHWHRSAELRLEGPAGRAHDDTFLPELRGDAILYLWDRVAAADALGYHERNAGGLPFGIVFTELSAALDEPWTVTLSHEALELIGDPEANRLVAGPHPGDPKREVFHWYQMCDAVQDERYPIDGVWVSNFLLPLYFTASADVGGRNDFLGRLHHGRPLAPFGINPGCYVGFYDPSTRGHETVSRSGDDRARARLQVKRRAALTQRSTRYALGTAFRDTVRALGERRETVRSLRAFRRTADVPVREIVALETLDRAPLGTTRAPEERPARRPRVADPVYSLGAGLPRRGPSKEAACSSSSGNITSIRDSRRRG
jgi:hypothetical protein